LSPILKVFRKETREMFRDKRVRYAAMGGPFLMIVLILMLFGSIFGNIGKASSQRVHVVKTAAPEAAFLRAKGIQVIEVASVEEGRKLVEKGKARLVLDFHPGTTPEAQTVVDAYFDPKNQTGQIALAAVQGVYGAANKIALTNILKENGIPETVQEKIKVERKEVVIGEKGGASEFVVGMLPYLIVIWAFYGAMSIASDLVAGEKEKNTLETLLITPVRRTEIVLGKFLAISLLSLLSSMASVVGMAAVAIFRLPGAELLTKDGNGISLQAIGIILVVMLPLVAFFAALLITVSSYARNAREAQTYLAQVSAVVLMPAIFSQFIGFLDAGNAFWVHFVPILNTANNIRLALLGKPDFAGIGATVGISVLFAAIALWVTVKLFNREEVLVRV
jgi:sodium transport system permease protein